MGNKYLAACALNNLSKEMFFDFIRPVLFFSETLPNLPVVRTKQLVRSMKKTAPCKKVTELSDFNPPR